MNFRHLYIFLVLIGLFHSGVSLASSKIDTIYFQSGDRITGEVKSLQNNQLKLSTSDGGTVNVEWNKIDSVKILNNMRVLLDDGRIRYGKILTAGEAGQCNIWSSEGDPLQIAMARIVSLSPLQNTFMNRLTGSLSSGFSYMKSTEVLQMNFDGSVQYQAEKNTVELAYSGLFSQDSLMNRDQNQHGKITLFRVLPNNWFLVSNVSLESNSELELDLRTTLALGGGNSLVSNNFTRLNAAVGLQATRENSGGNYQNNMETFLVANYSVFIYEAPKVSVNLSAQLIPSLTSLGRVRTSVNSSLNWEIFSDFYLKWSFYFNSDSQPLSETAEKYDWAVTLLGLEYKL
jgi:hypothetical protein